MTRNHSTTVEFLHGPTVDGLPVEIVERKGVGHPDSLADGIAEAVAREVGALVQPRKAPPYIFADALILPGVSKPRFGGGDVTHPFRVWLLSISDPPIRPAFFRDLCRRYLTTVLRNCEPNYVQTEIVSTRAPSRWVRAYSDDPGTTEDTAVGIGYAPLGRLESLTLDLESHLNSGSFKEKMPALGEDIKILAYRCGENVDLTVASAFVSKYVRDLRHYVELKAQLQTEIDRFARERFAKAKSTINPDDIIAAGRVYLTVSGSCVENSDWGITGRGNRASGLITPFRATMIESVAGKNIQNHPAKLFSVLAKTIADALCSDLPIKEATVLLVGKISGKVTHPDIIHIRAVPSKKVSVAEVEEVAAYWLRRIPSVRKRYLDGQIRLF